MKWTVRDLMHSDPPTIPADATIDQALAVLLERDIGEVFVTDSDRRLLGVVPDYALLKARLVGVHPETGVERLMSRSLTTAQPDQPVEDVAPSFREGRYWQLPVVERGRLVGSIGRRDVLRLMAAHEPELARDGLEPENGPSSPRLPRFLQTRAQAAAELQAHGVERN